MRSIELRQCGKLCVVLLWVNRPLCGVTRLVEASRCEPLRKVSVAYRGWPWCSRNYCQGGSAVRLVRRRRFASVLSRCHGTYVGVVSCARLQFGDRCVCVCLSLRCVRVTRLCHLARWIALVRASSCARIVEHTRCHNMVLPRVLARCARRLNSVHRN